MQSPRLRERGRALVRRCRNETAIAFGDGHHAFVIAGGQGYVLETGTGSLLYKTRCSFLVDAVSVPGREFIVACTFTELLAYGIERELWESERIALDGIDLVESTPLELRGKLQQHDGCHPFALVYEGWRFRTSP